MPFAVGDSIGPYKILEQLGQGGMASVYKAYHASLDRYVAIKVLHPNLNQDSTFIARFKREARLIAKLDHPNIVAVHDFAEQDHYPYLVMKFIQGETLKDRLWRGPLTSQEINDVLDAVGSALEYAHQHGILHRDVKPSNVLLGADGHIYLADFGLARIAQDGESTLSTDSIVGTPQYISPEQALGKRDLDEGTDIYSFGVMLYEMVVGQVPFNSDTPFPIIYDHIYTPLPLPRSINPSVPASVERVLLKALAKDRADRYQKVSDLVAAFRSAWDEAGVPMQGTAIRLRVDMGKMPTGGSAQKTGSTPGSSQTTMPPRRKRSMPWLLAGGAALALFCCVGVAAALGLFGRFWPTTPLSVPTQTGTPSVFCEGEQTWLQRDYFPEKEIQHCWDRDHYIGDMAYNGSEWTLVMDKQVSYTDQAYFSASDFPKDKIKEYWDRGFDITSMSYSGSKWYVVMSVGTGFSNQSYITDAALSDADIKEYWDKGYAITSLAYGNGIWAVVMSKDAGLGAQVYFSDAVFPEDKVRNYWDFKYDVTTIAYGNSTWVVVMSTGTGFSNQYYYKREVFPEDGIAADWDNDFFITEVDFGGGLWLVVMSKQ